MKTAKKAEKGPGDEEMTNLTTLPLEVLHNILLWLNPADLVVTIPRVCRQLRAFTKGNQTLNRDNYLLHFDVPPKPELDWGRELHDLVKLQAICDRKDVSDKEHELGFVQSTVIRLLLNASPADGINTNSDTHHPSRNVIHLQSLFKQESTKQAFLHRSTLFERVQTRGAGCSPSLAHQQGAKLHCLYSRPILTMDRTRSRSLYPYACSKVYDLRQYTRLTKWGPFMNDETDRVDWEKVEAILIVLGHNISANHLMTRPFSDVWDNPFAGSWPGSYMSPSSSGPQPEAGENYGVGSSTDQIDPELEAQDPYGVTGTWYRIVCFIDYHDFFAYNFSDDHLPEMTPRLPLDTGEATRLIQMNIHVTAIEPPGPEDGDELPVVHFRGVSRSLDDSLDANANSDVRGTVRLTREGEVRWTTFSIFSGQERWRSEGVQIGGLRSARGVVGNWFDIDYDRHGPAGPTAFWKAATRPSDRPITLYDTLPNDFFVDYHNLIDDSDLDLDDEGTDDDDDEEEEDEDEDDDDEDDDDEDDSDEEEEEGDDFDSDEEGDDDEDDDDDDEHEGLGPAGKELLGLLRDAATNIRTLQHGGRA